MVNIQMVKLKIKVSTMKRRCQSKNATTWLGKR